MTEESEEKYALELLDGKGKSLESAQRPAEVDAWFASEKRRILDEMAKIQVTEALNYWLSTLSPATGKMYSSTFKRLQELKLVNLNYNLRQFSFINHEAVIDDIKSCNFWKEATKQNKAATYVSFTEFLERRTKGAIKKAVPKSRGVNKTFYAVREKVKTPALSKNQTILFLRALEYIEPRMALIARIILQGGKRKDEVLSLEIKNIDFSKNRISFIQSKTSGKKKITVINYPPHVMKELKEYIGDRVGLAFITRTGKKIAGRHLNPVFIKAGKRAGVAFPVTPHVLRVTLVTRLKELRVQDHDIMKITGHTNIQQLAAYDKSELGNNATLQYCFV